jgi:hypothetical protein
MIKPKAIFLLNLVQDVNILRPLMFMADRDFGFDVSLLVSSKFIGRDLFGIWQAEIEQICAELDAQSAIYHDSLEAHQHLVGSGIIFAGSESSLPAHSATHDIFRQAPAAFMKVTLQHGFECIGFRHSADHNLAHGETASFGADVVCGWYDSSRLTSMAASQRAKLHVTGPTAVLQQPLGFVNEGRTRTGIVCENLHSVRLNIAGDFRTQFVDAFGEYCHLLGQQRRSVTLRPHPGGQYVLKNKMALPANALINNAPMYKLNLRKFSYGISAPSSVLIDMLLADIPTAVWRDRNGVMDAGNYAGLTTVSTPREWLEFSEAAEADPVPFVTLQRDFLQGQGMPLDPHDVFERYADLFRSATRMTGWPNNSAAERDRVLFIANANVPTLQLSFEKPLRSLVERGVLASQLLTEAELRKLGGDNEDQVGGDVRRLLSDYAPSLIVFCRYSGPVHAEIVKWARHSGVPILYHIDDDLLAIPEDIGARKHALHNRPERLEAVRTLLKASDLVYASTENLRAKLLEYFPNLPVKAGKIYCSGAALHGPSRHAARRVGYMASADHAHNLAMIIPAIVTLLDRHDHVGFELFGSISVPAGLERFGDRITKAPPVSDYERFLEEFSARGWDIGICPLVPIPFNRMKANTKWVEYTSAGVAVVASRGMVYDECCAEGCGLLADSSEEWLAALELLVTDDQARADQIERAQLKLANEYNVAILREQVLGMFAACRELVPQRSDLIKKELAIVG